MYLNKQNLTSRLSLSTIVILGLTLGVLTGASAAKPLDMTTTTTTTTTTAASTNRAVAKPSPHLKKRKAIKSRKRGTTVVHSNTSLSGGISKKRRHAVHSLSVGKSSAGQQKRSAKLNAFLKNPPKMKKAPYFNPPGLDVPSGAL